MGDTTGIEWTDSTWNPIRGCSRVSEGCRNCYAERVAARFSGPGLPYEGLAGLKVITINPDEPGGELRPYWTGKLAIAYPHLADPLRWKRPRRIFVNSMSDLFHERLDNTTIAAIFGIMAAAPQHTFQVLTKRPKRMRAWFEWATPNEFDILHNHADEFLQAAGIDIPHRWRLLARYADDQQSWRWPLPNVQLGVSVEDQETAEERIPVLQATPAAVRFISAEPLLGRVTLRRLRNANGYTDGLTGDSIHTLGAMSGVCLQATTGRVHWVIAGGESGPKARPMRADWARALRDDCNSGGTSFFFKQWGEHNERGLLVGKRKAGSLLDGREYKEFPR